MLSKFKALELINKMVCKAVGCTEPVAIALAVTTAYHEIGGAVKKVIVTIDKNVFKNAMAVGIPGTNYKGPKMAIALAIVCGDPDGGLCVLKNVNPDAIRQAEELLKQDFIEINLDENASQLHIHATVITDKGEAIAVIDGCHDHIVLIKKNDQVIYKDVGHGLKSSCFLDDYNLSDLSLSHVIKLADSLDLNELEYLKNGIEVNLSAAKIGLKEKSGMGLGAAYEKLMATGVLGKEFINHVKIMAAAASDARMGGVKVPIMACAGSGNHGITFFIAIGLAFKYLPIQPEISLTKALAFGILILAIFKKNTGMLTPICGCGVAAGTAASAAIVYALGGDENKILAAINLVLGNIAGLVCDGGKYGCSLKIGSSVVVAVESAMLAMENITVPDSDGIVGHDFAQTLQNLSLLHKQGMEKVDATILQILKNKT